MTPAPCPSSLVPPGVVGEATPPGWSEWLATPAGAVDRGIIPPAAEPHPPRPAPSPARERRVDPAGTLVPSWPGPHTMEGHYRRGPRQEYELTDHGYKIEEIQGTRPHPHLACLRPELLQVFITHRRPGEIYKDLEKYKLQKITLLLPQIWSPALHPARI
ncbi:hypothetical protein SKAU_G00321410 [Synaphobranchus kaupii]|uniref:Uncharacterized protein n=1 Tax=Synaphobranchus kaupii TaxID=118154 RepID=A0A9Q1ENY3_SYNKA|nr:hypothetical protein SKAU_G00321410 [Synaphobranchus kaupii]